MIKEKNLLNMNFDEQIKNTLSSYGQKPPKDCWNNLSSQLNNPIPKPTKSFFSSIAGKTIIGTICLASAAITTIVLRQQSQNAEQNTQKNIVLQTTDSVYTEESSFIQQTNDSIKETIVAKETKEKINKKNDSTLEEDKIEEINLEDEKFFENNISQNFHENQDISVETEEVVQPVQNDNVLESTKETENVAKTEQKNLPQAEEQPQQPELFIPNLISPNGDGLNDYFEIKGIENTELNHLIIFTNQGKVVFETKNYNNDWSADNLPDNVYYYYFKFIYNNNQFMRKGSITIRR